MPLVGTLGEGEDGPVGGAQEEYLIEGEEAEAGEAGAQKQLALELGVLVARLHNAPLVPKMNEKAPNVSLGGLVDADAVVGEAGDELLPQGVHAAHALRVPCQEPAFLRRPHDRLTTAAVLFPSSRVSSTRPEYITSTFGSSWEPARADIEKAAIRYQRNQSDGIS